MALVVIGLLDALLFSVSRDPDDTLQGAALPLLLITASAGLAPLLALRSVRLFKKVAVVTSCVLFLCSFVLYYAGVMTLLAALLHCAARLEADED